MFCRQVHDDVHVRFEDGSECVVHDPDVELLIPAEYSSLFPDEEQCAYFPGLVVHASTSVLRGAKWVRGKRSQVSLFLFSYGQLSMTSCFVPLNSWAGRVYSITVTGRTPAWSRRYPQGRSWWIGSTRGTCTTRMELG